MNLTVDDDHDSNMPQQQAIANFRDRFLQNSQTVLQASGRGRVGH
jgi:hypothetical protein